jgi:hypothetical protein
MSRPILVLTLLLWGLPALLLAAAISGQSLLAGPAILVTAVYAWVWVRFRPTCFVVRPDALEVVWPLKKRAIPRSDITSIQLIGRAELRKAIGWGVRVGAGGLWGGFGWLWTTRRGIVQMYVSRTDRFIWIETTSRPWLITPERLDEFAAALKVGA